MKKLNVFTETYDCGDNFRVDIVQEGNYFEAWIYHSCFGEKALMYGVNNCSKEEFITVLENNLDYYICNYKEDNYIS